MTDNRDFNLECQQLNLLLAQINADEANLELLNFDDKVRHLWSYTKSLEEKVACINLAAAMSITFLRDALILGFSMEAYEAKDYSTAFYGFLKGAQVGSSDAKNNLAYMIRRNEYGFDGLDGLDKAATALKLLVPGVKEREPFSIVNTALILCLILKEDHDWQTADKLFKYVTEKEQSVCDWWANLGEDIEGYLVHFFLLRHEKIEHSNLGSIKSIALRLSKSIDGFPEWLAKEYAIETLNDVIECLDDPDFDTILEDFLEKMPCSRESVEEMMETVSTLDLWSVYNKLLTDCAALLSPEELAKLKADYKEKFSIPLPGETE